MPGDLLDKCRLDLNNFGMKHKLAEYLMESCEQSCDEQLLQILSKYCFWLERNHQNSLAVLAATGKNVLRNYIGSYYQ